MDLFMDKRIEKASCYIEKANALQGFLYENRKSLSDSKDKDILIDIWASLLQEATDEIYYYLDDPEDKYIQTSTLIEIAKKSKNTKSKSSNMDLIENIIKEF